MMLRMYTRYVADIGLDHELDDVQPGEEAGIKSATVTVEGRHAYAILEAERVCIGWYASRRSTPTRGATRPSPE